jgi:hypothetical protein
MTCDVRENINRFQLDFVRGNGESGRMDKKSEVLAEIKAYEVDVFIWIFACLATGFVCGFIAGEILG